VCVCVCVCVWMLTRAAQVITAAHRDLWSCMHRPTKDLWSQTKNNFRFYFTDYAFHPPPKKKWAWMGFFKPAEFHSSFCICATYTA